ncbi:tRNA (guanosine(37)-N1)-methyltransferase TrmD [bacterium]|nr:tRNA (guanosine(37)-N1)-methyltransferase TrmD [bacterium]
MRIDILTTFIEMFAGPFDESIIKRAREAGQVDIRIHNLRDWTHDKHHKTDDEQYGGGDGMLMLAQPLLDAVHDLSAETDGNTHVILTTPQGRIFEQPIAEELVEKPHIIFICGHYKGVDQRVIDLLQPNELSIGDFILTGGELPTMVMVDAVVRLIPGVVGKMQSVEEDSFTSGLLDCPRYTRPREIGGLEAPDVLLSGNHAEIEKWRLQQAVNRTAERRPDLYQQWLQNADASEKKRIELP